MLNVVKTRETISVINCSPLNKSKVIIRQMQNKHIVGKKLEGKKNKISVSSDD